MVKQAKTKKGSIGKKALAAILAASMVLSSSAFSVLAAVVDEPVPAKAEIGSKLVVVVNDDGLKYNGSGKTPQVAVYDCDGTDNGTHTNNGSNCKLVSGTEYKVTPHNNINAGEGSNVKGTTAADYGTLPYVHVDFSQGTGTYKDEPNQYVGFDIAPLEFDSGAIEIISDLKEGFDYNGKDQYPGMTEVDAILNGNPVTLKKDVDYVVQAADNADLKSASDNKEVVLKGINNYTDTKSITYNINQIDVKDSYLSIEADPLELGVDGSLDYVGNIVVKDILQSPAKTLKEGVDYFVQYQKANGDWISIDAIDDPGTPDNNEQTGSPIPKIGNHKLRIVTTGKGDYKAKGIVVADYEVVPKGTLRAYVRQHYKIGEFADNATVVYDGTDKFPTNDLIWEVGKKEDDTSALTAGRNYKLVTPRTKWINAGDYTLELQGLDVLKDQTAEIKVKITPRSLDATDVKIKAQRGTHTNSKSRAGVTVTVTDSGIKTDDGVNSDNPLVLEENVDYTVDTTSKSGYAVIKGKGNYTGRKDVKIEDLTNLMPIDDSSINAEVTKSYTLNQQKQSIKVQIADIKMVEKDTPSDYTLISDDYNIIGYEQDGIKYDASVGVPKAGQAFVIVAGKGKFTSMRKIPFTIVGSSLTTLLEIAPIDDIELKDSINAADLEDKIVVRYISDKSGYSKTKYTATVYDPEGYEVAQRTATGDWTGSIEKTGTYKVVVKSTDGRLEDTIEATFNVVGINLAGIKDLTIGEIEGQKYTGVEVRPNIEVKIGGQKLVEGTDYTVSYEHNVNVGSAYAIITGMGKYSGSVEKKFNIVKVDGTVTLKAAQLNALAKGRKVGNSNCVPKLVASIDGQEVNDTTLKVDEMVSSNTSVAKITSSGREIKYVGKGTATITITPSSDNLNVAPFDVTVKVTGTAASTSTPAKETPVAHLTLGHFSNKAGTFGITTNKIKKATKWQVAYATKKSMAGKKTKTVKTAKRLYRKTITVDKSNTLLYVRVRAYVDGKWTKWSEKEHIRTK